MTGKLTDRERRKRLGEETAPNIVDETIEALARDLAEIMKPVRGRHQFELRAPKAIRICKHCGKPEMRRVKLSNCSALEALKGERE